MGRNIVNFLKKESQLFISRRRAMRLAGVSSAFVFFIFFILQPFSKVYDLFLERVYISFTYASVTFLFLLFLKDLRINKLFKKNITVLNELILSIFLFIPLIWSMSYFVFYTFLTLFPTEHIFENAISFCSFFNGFVVGFFVLFFSRLIEFLDYLKNKADRIDKKGKKQEESNRKIHLVSQMKEKVILDLSDILCFESSRNYIHVYFFQEEEIATIEIRKTMKDMEEELNDCKCFYRIYRSFIINLNYVTEFNGRSKSPSILLSTGKSVPVSRDKIAEVKERLLQCR